MNDARPILSSPGAYLSKSSTLEISPGLEKLIDVIPHIIPYCYPADVLYSLAGIHRAVRARIYTRAMLKLIFPAGRSFYKTLAVDPGSKYEHHDTRYIRSLLRRPNGRSVLWQLLIRGETPCGLTFEEYRIKWEDGLARDVTKLDDRWKGFEVTTDYEIILKDIGRTFADSDMFAKGKLNETLFRILATAADQNDTMGYCQGFNFVCANLLVHMDFPRVVDPIRFFQCFELSSPKANMNRLFKEIDAEPELKKKSDEDSVSQPNTIEFLEALNQTSPKELRSEALVYQTLQSMVKKLSLDGQLFDREMSGQILKCNIFHRLCKLHVPKLVDHIANIGFPDLNFFACNWFGTILIEPCSKVEPIDFLHKGTDKLITGIWEQFILRGWKVLFRIGLFIMAELECAILRMDDMEPIQRYLNNPFKYMPTKGLECRQRSDRGEGQITCSWLLRVSYKKFKVTQTIIDRIEGEINGVPEHTATAAHESEIPNPPNAPVLLEPEQLTGRPEKPSRRGSYLRLFG